MFIVIASFCSKFTYKESFLRIRRHNRPPQKLARNPIVNVEVNDV